VVIINERAYSLGLLNRRKDNWIHAGSIPAARTTYHYTIINNRNQPLSTRTLRGSQWLQLNPHTLFVLSALGFIGVGWYLHKWLGVGQRHYGVWRTWLHFYRRRIRKGL